MLIAPVSVATSTMAVAPGEQPTGSSVIDPDFVLLTDDKGLQPADNAIAVWRVPVDSTQLSSVIDAVNVKLDTAAFAQGWTLTGSGEPPTAAIGSAVANAFFDATGVRIRQAPMNPTHVRAALKSAGIK